MTFIYVLLIIICYILWRIKKVLEYMAFPQFSDEDVWSSFMDIFDDNDFDDQEDDGKWL